MDSSKNEITIKSTIKYLSGCYDFKMFNQLFALDAFSKEDLPILEKYWVDLYYGILIHGSHSINLTNVLDQIKSRYPTYQDVKQFYINNQLYNHDYHIELIDELNPDFAQYLTNLFETATKLGLSSEFILQSLNESVQINNDVELDM